MTVTCVVGKANHISSSSRSSSIDNNRKTRDNINSELGATRPRTLVPAQARRRGVVVHHADIRPQDGDGRVPLRRQVARLV